MRDGVESARTHAAQAGQPAGSESLRVSGTAVEPSDDVISWAGRRGGRAAE
jgi:hypothetical protein